VEERCYYLCRVRFRGAEVFVLWYSDDCDGFVRDEAGRLLAASSPESLLDVAAFMGISSEDSEPTGYDFDHLRAWCAAPKASEIDCNTFLDAWNFFDDLARLHECRDTPWARLSRGARLHSSDTPEVRSRKGALPPYDKLFWGCNLPAVTPPGERYEPKWSARDLAQIRRVMKSGLDLFESELRAADNPPQDRPGHQNGSRLQ
jgi:hypothetical protein